MIDRGGCSFVTKSRNVAHAGGAMAVVIDTRDEIADNILMSDDGTGSSITIPSMLIGYRHGNILRDFMNKASKEELAQVKLMAKFEIKYKAKPQVQVWYSSADKKFLKFLADLDDYLIDVEDHLDWEPRFPTYSCPECQSNYKHENCLGDGRYCVMETFPAKNDDFKPKQILMENLRQLCMQKHTGKHRMQHKFFKYLREIVEFGGYPTEQDSQIAAKAADVDWE